MSVAQLLHKYAAEKGVTCFFMNASFVCLIGFGDLLIIKNTDNAHFTFTCGLNTRSNSLQLPTASHEMGFKRFA